MPPILSVGQTMIRYDCSAHRPFGSHQLLHPDTVNAFNDMADIVRLYSKKPEAAEQRLENLLSEVLYEDSDSV